MSNKSGQNDPKSALPPTSFCPAVAVAKKETLRLQRGNSAVPRPSPAHEAERGRITRPHLGHPVRTVRGQSGPSVSVVSSRRSPASGTEEEGLRPECGIPALPRRSPIQGTEMGRETRRQKGYSAETLRAQFASNYEVRRIGNTCQPVLRHASASVLIPRLREVRPTSSSEIAPRRLPRLRTLVQAERSEERLIPAKSDGAGLVPA